MTSLKSLNLSCLLTVLLIMVEGCAHRSPIPRKIAPEAASLLDSIQQSNARIQSFRGQGQLKTTNQGEAQVYRVAWLASRPEQFRFDILSPWGQPTATFAMNGKKLFFYIYAKDTLYQEEATAENIARFIHIRITPAELLKVLSGSIPIVPFYQAQLQPVTEGESILTLVGRWGDIVEKVWIRHGPLTVLHADYFNHEGALTYRIVFDNFMHAESVTIPYVIHISGKNSTTWSLTVKRYAINIPISQENFNLGFTRNNKRLDLR